MRINQVRRILDKRTQELSNQLQKKMDKDGITKEEVMLNDPFLSGQIYLLGMIGLDWIIADDQEIPLRRPND